MEQCDDIHDEELNFLDKSGKIDKTNKTTIEWLILVIDILQERTRGKKVSRYSEALKKLAGA